MGGWRTTIVGGLPITYDRLPDNARAVEVAVDLQRHSAYDAAYLALAERLDGEVWTLDGPLARNAAGRYRVRLIDWPWLLTQVERMIQRGPRV